MTNDYNVKDPQIKTPAHEKLVWNDLPPDSDNYAEMERKKDAARRKKEESDESSMVDSLTTRERDRLIAERAEQGVGQKTLAEAFDISQPRVSQLIAEYDG